MSSMVPFDKANVWMQPRSIPVCLPAAFRRMGDGSLVNARVRSVQFTATLV